jgi:hypothetical protein
MLINVESYFKWQANKDEFNTIENEQKLVLEIVRKTFSVI